MTARYKNLLMNAGDSAGEFVGQSPAVAALKRKAETIAGTGATVLIQGPTGTGKEVLAHYIHQKSPRRNKPFVKVDCSTIPQELMESELFGHEKGAFTGAVEQKKGCFEQANAGTLFLDEAGNLSLAMQTKLLQFFQDRKILRVGGVKSIPLDARILVASNVPLLSLVEKGKFRSDLFYRIDVVSITLPPLIERPEDLPALCRYFLDLFNVTHNKRIRDLSPAAYEKIYAYPWPGNIRELKNTIERSVIFCEKDVIEPDLITFSTQHVRSLVSLARSFSSRLTADELRACFKKHNGVLRKAAQELKMPVRTLYHRIKKMGHSPDDFRPVRRA